MVSSASNILLIYIFLFYYFFAIDDIGQYTIELIKTHTYQLVMVKKWARLLKYLRKPFNIKQ